MGYSDSLVDSLPIQGPAIKITTEMIPKALTKMKKGKAASPSGINAEMLLAGDEDILPCELCCS